MIASWNYPPPYEIYSLHNSPSAVCRLVDGRYYSVLHRGQLIGVFCYGPAAQLKTDRVPRFYKNHGYLDIGLALRPCFCGRGLGYGFLQAGLTYASERFSANQFRLTVAANNQRAVSVYTRSGFKEKGRILRSSGPIREFIVMSLDNFRPVPISGQARSRWERLEPFPANSGEFGRLKAPVQA